MKRTVCGILSLSLLLLGCGSAMAESALRPLIRM